MNERLKEESYERSASQRARPWAEETHGGILASFQTDLDLDEDTSANLCVLEAATSIFNNTELQTPHTRAEEG